MKNICIRSHSGQYFPAFGLNTENPCSDQIWENTDQKNSEYGHFSRGGRNDLENDTRLTSFVYLRRDWVHINPSSENLLGVCWNKEHLVLAFLLFHLLAPDFPRISGSSFCYSIYQFSIKSQGVLQGYDSHRSLVVLEVQVNLGEFVILL